MNNPTKAALFPAAHSLPLNAGAVGSEHPSAIPVSCDVVCNKAELTQKSPIWDERRRGLGFNQSGITDTYSVMLTSSQGCPGNGTGDACSHVEDKRCLVWSPHPNSGVVLRLVNTCLSLNVPLVVAVISCLFSLSYLSGNSLGSTQWTWCLLSPCLVHSTSALHLPTVIP